jgi:NPCBM/NEW2 domain-containing protein/melibiase-like protein
MMKDMPEKISSVDFSIEFESDELKLWPHTIPCRIKDGHNCNIFFICLGDVKTAAAQGHFDPVKDEVRLHDGTVIPAYYKDKAGINYFSVIDKKNFPLPPSGWCSWYYYYQELNEDEIMKNADWIAANLKDFGAECIQLDDGWQGIGRGERDNRDWTIVDKRFPGGLESLASKIKKLGLVPGLWLAPHGQSNEALVKENDRVFFTGKDGESVSDTWVGKFLLDPSTEESGKYLENLFASLVKQGIEYFKIDGQPIVITEYKQKKNFMKNTGESPEFYYRKTLEHIRAAIGNDRFLLGCWGVPKEGVGIFNGSRTSGDVALGWKGFLVALGATMQYYFLHNIAWYCDPDVMLLRSPLSLDQARAWATLQGLTGQALMASDRMTDLSPSRVEILKRVFPAVDARPLDLFPSYRNKTIWDLKISKAGREYDVVGVFNYDEKSAAFSFLSWDDLCIPSETPVHVFDFWNREYIGAFEGGILVDVPPSACRVFSLIPCNDEIQIISTNRHITQGWIDLDSANYDPGEHIFSGVSKVIKNDPYEIRFVYPRNKNYKILNAKAGNFEIEIENFQGWGIVRIFPTESITVVWEANFEASSTYSYPVSCPQNLSFFHDGKSGVMLEWTVNFSLCHGYIVSVDDNVIGWTPRNFFPLKNLVPGRKYKASVSAVWKDGTRSKESAEIEFVAVEIIPEKIYLSDMEPMNAASGWGVVEMDRSILGARLKLGGEYFDKGLGTHSNSIIEYELKGIYNRFNAIVGIDDRNFSEKDGCVEFIVYGDSKEIWRSGILYKKDCIRKIDIDITGVNILRLVVNDGDQGNLFNHADWISARVF